MLHFTPVVERKQSKPPLTQVLLLMGGFDTFVLNHQIWTKTKTPQATAA
jgi:hypothetical protein